MNAPQRLSRLVSYETTRFTDKYSDADKTLNKMENRKREAVVNSFYRVVSAPESLASGPRVQPLNPQPISLKSILKALSDLKYDLETPEAIAALRELASLPEDEKKILFKSHKKELKQLVEVLRYSLEDDLEMEPFIDENFAQKMNDMTEEEYEQYLQEFADTYAEEGGNKYEKKYPRIGSLFRSLKELKITDEEVWELSLKFVQKSRCRTTLEESVRGIEGLSFYLDHIISENRELKFERLLAVLCLFERTIVKTLWYDNISYFGRIVRALGAVNKTDNFELYDKVQHYMLNMLGSEYKADEIVDTAYWISQSGHASREFYEEISLVIARGHRFKFSGGMMLMKPRGSSSDFTFTLENMRKIVAIYDAAGQKYGPKFYVYPDFKVKMYRDLVRLSSPREDMVPLPQLSHLFFFANSPSLEMEDIEVKELKHAFVNKAFQLEESNRVDASELALFIRNTVLPEFSTPDAARFLALIDRKLEKGQVGSDGIEGWTQLTNTYLENNLLALGEAQDQIPILSALQKYAQGNRMRLKYKQIKALEDLGEKITLQKQEIQQREEQMKLEGKNESQNNAPKKKGFFGKFFSS